MEWKITFYLFKMENMKHTPHQQEYTQFNRDVEPKVIEVSSGLLVDSREPRWNSHFL